MLLEFAYDYMLNNTIQDILIRKARLDGLNVVGCQVLIMHRSN